MRGATVALALAALAGCQHPKGRCDRAADCASNETCDAGVCVRVEEVVEGNGSGGGTDPTTFTPVLWSTLATAPGASFAPVSVTADTSGDVLVAADAGAAYAPWALAAGGFAARAAAGDGALAGLVRFPTFSHGAVRAAALPEGELLFAGRALDPTTVGTLTYVPPAAGTLVLGRLGAGGDPVWVVTVDGTSASAAIAPVAASARGADLVVAGTGAGDFGCGDTAGATFAAVLSGADGRCLWSRGFASRTLANAKARPAGDVAVAGLCTPTGASFDLGGGAACMSGMFVAILGAADGATTWARTTAGGTVSAVRDLSAGPDGSVAVVGDGRGAVTFAPGAPATDLGALDASFVVAYDAGGALRYTLRPVEAPLAPFPDAASFGACAWDDAGRLWLAGRYAGQPTIGGVRFAPCRDACVTAAFLARVDGGAGAPTVGSFLPVRIAASPAGVAWADDLVLGATTGTVAWALRFSGDATVGTSRWVSDGAGLGIVRVAP